MFRTISARIAIPVIACVVALFGVLSAAALYFVRKDLQEGSGEQVAALVERAANDIDARLSSRIGALEAAARRYRSPDDTLDETAAEEFLREQITLVSLYNSLLMMSPEGRVVADWPAVPGRRGMDFSDRDFFPGLRDSVRSHVSEPFRTAFGDRPAFAVTTPVHDSAGRIIAYLTGSIELLSNEFLDEVRHARIGQNGRYLIATKSGRMIVHPSNSRILSPVSRQNDGPMLARALDGWSGWAEGFDSAQRMAVVAYRPLRHAGWIVGGSLPVVEAYEPLRRVEFLILAAALIAAAIIAALVPMLTTRSLAPLGKLRAQIDEINSGSRVGRVAEAGAQEIQVVARAFNALIESRARVETSLRNSEAFYRTLADHSPAGILTLSESGQCSYANHEWVRLTGHPAPTVIGTPWLDHVAAEERKCAEGGWLRAREAAQPIEFETKFVRSDRSLLHARVRLSPIREGGRRLGYLATVEDVGPQREAHRQLLQEKARADTILLAMTDAIALIDSDGRIDRVNPAAASLLGWDKSVCGLPMAPLLQLYNDEDGSRVSAEPLMASARVESDEWSCETPAFGRVPVEVRWYRTDPGEALGTEAAREHRGGVLVVRDVAERRRHAKRVAWQAMHDSLTGLANRRAFEEALGHAFSRFRRQGTPSALLMIDLDRFKQVNDTGGHAAGDEMLCQVASLIRSSLRSSDLPARLGGDEFAILLPGCDTELANRIATMIREGIESICLERDGLQFRVGASVGVSATLPGDTRVSDLMERADSACYQAKSEAASSRELIESLRRKGSRPAQVSDQEA